MGIGPDPVAVCIEEFLAAVNAAIAAFLASPQGPGDITTLTAAITAATTTLAACLTAAIVG
ncbi:hypothetical protein [Halalkalibacter lacteus]|uniref:hypothetical protein n=1 Tax=Halalkalibacter lacteus TaxID=3090663 RepID=UPI002FCA9E3B